MKKVSLLVLLAILASTLLMAAIPTQVVRLTIINKSGSDVYMKLTGSAVTDAFYYLTVPAGDRDAPTVKVFTVMVDVYDRETWQCDGLMSSGTLVVDGNVRFTFTPCYEYGCGGFSPKWVDARWIDRCTGKEVVLTDWFRKRQAGEPTMEKVAYFKILQKGMFGGRYWGTPYQSAAWAAAFLYTGYWQAGCGNWYYRIRTYMLPYGCQWRYQY